MTHTITALFDSRADAEAAENRLKAANVETGHIGIHDKSSPDFDASGRSTTAEPGIWASIKNAFLPDQDRRTYEEGVRRGGVLLTADVADDHIDAAVRVLEDADTIDIDSRADEWRASGWDYASGPGPVDVPADAFDDDSISATNADREFIFGQRDAARGSARVRSYSRDNSGNGQR
ncbi:MAG: hypothetical protein JWO15_2465 [Sphingomonadales bacterium]|nr:hypothetical protein [Sphingomonadales bacterium]